MSRLVATSDVAAFPGNLTPRRLGGLRVRRGDVEAPACGKGIADIKNLIDNGRWVRHANP